jgi:septal ring factor EnvC (AmiA/AmiB activator)
MIRVVRILILAGVWIMPIKVQRSNHDHHRAYSVAWAEPSSRDVDEHSQVNQGSTHHHAHTHGEEERSVRQTKDTENLSQLFALDQRILKLSRQQQMMREKLDGLNQRMSRYQNEIKSLNLKLKVDRTSLMRLLTLQERVKPARVVELLMSADGPLEQKRREVYLNALFKTGTRRLKALSLARRKLRSRQRAITKISEQTQQLTDLLSRQAQVLTNERRAEWEAISAHQVTQSNRDSRAQGSKTLRMKWGQPTRLPPTQGEWIDEFRSFRGLSLAKMYGGGVWIMNGSGAPTYSVERGEVIFSGHVRGWGGVVMIEHRFSYMSIYANLSQLLVKQGAQVKMQDRIGNSGSIAGREGLYFELRRGGEPIHPERWINRETPE